MVKNLFYPTEKGKIFTIKKCKFKYEETNIECFLYYAKTDSGKYWKGRNRSHKLEIYFDSKIQTPIPFYKKYEENEVLDFPLYCDEFVLKSKNVDWIRIDPERYEVI